METHEYIELSPLFGAASSETSEWLLSILTAQEWPEGKEILAEDDWGNAVYFIVSGWVKIRRRSSGREIAQSVLGRSDFFGEIAILDEPPRDTEAIALSPVRLYTLSAQRFIQTLFKDPQLHHKLLQLSIKRLRQTYARLHVHHHPATVKLARTLVSLAENYGTPTETGMEIFDLAPNDFADLSDISLEETERLLAKWKSKGWLEASETDRRLCVTNLKQLTHLLSSV